MGLIGRRTRRNVSMLACFTGKVETPPIVSCENEAAFNHVKKILLNKLRTLHFLTVSNLSLYSLLQACLWSLSVFPFVLIFFFCFIITVIWPLAVFRRKCTPTLCMQFFLKKKAHANKRTPDNHRRVNTILKLPLLLRQLFTVDDGYS